MNIQLAILDILKNTGEKTLYQINDEKITYKECYKRVIELAGNLIKQGTSPVVVYGHKSIDQFISIIACLIAKRSYIPIDLCTPSSRIKEIVDSAKATLIIQNEKLEIKSTECLTITEINKKYENKLEKFSSNNEIAYIIYTSGSTGMAKGVPITYHNLSHFINWIINLEEHKDCDDLNILSQASFSFDLSLMDLYFAIFKHNHIIAVDGETKEDLTKMYNTIKNNEINYLIMTPTFAKMLLIDDYFKDDNFKSIKYMFFCGECLEVETVKKIKTRFPNVIVINAYGPTEATCCVTMQIINDKMLEKNILPVGKISTAAVAIEIKNNEIVLKGDSVFNGYLDGNNQNCYHENEINCYKTGDIGYIENDYLYCQGRLDNQIKYQGYRIELNDIENNLLKIKGVREACVIAKYKDDNKTVRLIKAFVTTDADLTDLDIKSKLATLIPHYMIPKKIVIIDEIPVNDNGKYDRKKLTEL